MKCFSVLLIMLALWMGSSSQVTDSSVIHGVQQSLRTGSAQQLAAFFDTNIELIIDSEAIEFSAVQATHAEYILKSFFRKYPPRRFQYVYQRATAHQYYSTGIYQTGHEQFQVYVRMRELAGRTDRSRAGTPSHGTPPTNRPGPGIRQYVINALHFRKAN